MPGGERGLEDFRSVVDGGLMDRFVETGREGEEVLAELRGSGRGILEWRQLRFECRCSKERAARALRSCGASEIHDIINKERSTTLTCHFCNDQWRFERNELEQILVELDRMG
jgi:molecular chaperone Hsp33